MTPKGAGSFGIFDRIYRYLNRESTEEQEERETQELERERERDRRLLVGGGSSGKKN